jgi:hypothetical protein
MQQLGLLDANGPTADGDVVLARALKVLSGGTTA